MNLSRLPSFRAEHFPPSGPYPWLDLPNASDEIERRVLNHQLSAPDGDLCRRWAADGYVILNRLINADTLDAVWEGYEQAVRKGKLTLPPEPAGENDPYPGRCLNPHEKVGAFCRLLKHPELTRAPSRGCIPIPFA